jgi:hypothetical protein
MLKCLKQIVKNLLDTSEVSLETCVSRNYVIQTEINDKSLVEQYLV